MEALAGPRPPLGPDQQDHEAEHDQRDLGGAAGVAHAQPDVEHAGGQGPHGEEVDGAEIVQAFHERQGDADRDRRPGERQRDVAQRPPGAAAERAADLEHADRLLEEGGTGKGVDVRVQHQRQHRDRAAERTDLRKPVVALAGPAESLAQRDLQRSGEFKQVGVDVGDQVAGHGQRQQQRPFEQPAAGKPAHRHQPRGAGPDHEGPDPDPEHQGEGGQDVARQHRRGEMRPDVLGRR